jgi:hypothetical protein
LVPLEHGIQDFGKLSAATLVDATGVDPRQTIASLLGNLAELGDLLVPGSVFDSLARLAELLV